LFLGSVIEEKPDVANVNSKPRKALTEARNPAWMCAMKTQTIGLTLAFSFLVAAVSFAADPQMGTWKLNEAKSKATPGMGKVTMVTYKSMLGNVKVSVDGVDAKGKPTHSEWSGKIDGKDYPVTGDPNSDARSYTKVNDRTMDFAVKKGGRTMITGRIVVAADGKSRTVTTTGTDSKGKKLKTASVYDKQ
jgi:hypothetical protein